MKDYYKIIIDVVRDPRFEKEFPGVEYTSKDISEGDKYYNQYGTEHTLKILDKTYTFGYVYVTEDDDNWAQAESYRNDFIYCDGKHITYEHLADVLLNYKTLKRDKNLEDILNS